MATQINSYKYTYTQTYQGEFMTNTEIQSYKNTSNVFICPSWFVVVFAVN